MKSNFLLIGFFLVFQNTCFCSDGPWKNLRSSSLDISAERDVKDAAALGLRWILAKQDPAGSWCDDPAITGLVLSAILRADPPDSVRHTAIRKGFDYLMPFIHSDGSIYKIEGLKNYTTSIILRTFKDGNDPLYSSAIRNAEKFLISIQFNEEHGYTEDSLQYGGIGYGTLKPGSRPDLSNLQWTLMGLTDAKKVEVEKPRTDEERQIMKAKKQFMSRVSVYLKKCQNLSSVNPKYSAYNDGGFMYSPAESKAGDKKSYGSMTYAGLLSMIYIDLNRSDPRIQAAYHWIQRNYTVEENPGMQSQGLFYYYHTLAKALHAYGSPTITDTKKVTHNWGSDLTNKLMALQNGEGYWKNEVSPRWKEDNPVLVTAYAILTIEEILAETDKHKIPEVTK
jgi:squalene-hopene/tetraprenyl-beta-curcumene cyclase